LEITVVLPLRIYPYTRIGQLCFHSPVGEVDSLYNGAYGRDGSKNPQSAKPRNI